MDLYWWVWVIESLPSIIMHHQRAYTQICEYFKLTTLFWLCGAWILIQFCAPCQPHAFADLRTRVSSSPSLCCAVPGRTPLKQLMQDVMILAHAKGYDVFNALNLLEVRRLQHRYHTCSFTHRHTFAHAHAHAHAHLHIHTHAHTHTHSHLHTHTCLQNQEFLKDLKFGIGDGDLNYYLFNYRVGRPLIPSEVGLILM